MPIIGYSNYRAHLYADIDCPDDVVIPVKDPDAYKLNPDHAWAYNKLIIAEKQDLMCGPHGVTPPSLPVFSKPIYNMRSMGADSGLIHSIEEYEAHYRAGFMWCEALDGEHLSTDIAVLNGDVVWQTHTIGHALEGGTFDYWEVLAESRPDTEQFISAFVAQHFSNYTGMMNFETIGGKIIEMHLRFAEQWPDLYGAAFLENVVSLYSKNLWSLGRPEQDGYSVVLFAPPRNYKKPSTDFISQFIDTPNVLSIQLSFDDNVDFKDHSMPPGGMRIAIVNGHNLMRCKDVRQALYDEIMRLS